MKKSERTRERIRLLIKFEDRTIREIAEQLKICLSTADKHLRKLISDGFVWRFSSESDCLMIFDESAIGWVPIGVKRGKTPYRYHATSHRWIDGEKIRVKDL